jgi:hypothetical protein
LRLLIPGYRRHILKESPPQPEVHGENDQGKHKHFEQGGDRHWTSLIASLDVRLARGEPLRFDQDQAAAGLGPGPVSRKASPPYKARRGGF